MYTPAGSMDLERCQDLSELAWFEGAASWPAAEAQDEAPAMTMIDTYGQMPNISNPYEGFDYNINDIAKQPYYNLLRTDSIEEIKSLAVAAPMEVVPMQQREAMVVQNIVKIEKEDLDVGREEEIALKDDPFKVEEDEYFDFQIDSQELLQEFGDSDLVNFIISETHSQPSPPEVPRTPVLDSPEPSSTPSPPPERFSKTIRETRPAVPRDITSGASADKKIPKMVIVKTPQMLDLTTINFNDIGMSIAERIKTVGKRQRTKRYSEAGDDNSGNDDDDDEGYGLCVNSKKENDDDYFADSPRPLKRARRTSTTSSMSSSTGRYRELRDKNNMASRRSRQNRKEREKDLSQTLDDTTRRNTQLRARSDELEKLVVSLRKILLQVVLNRQP